MTVSGFNGEFLEDDMLNGATRMGASRMAGYCLIFGRGNFSHQ